MKNIALKSFIIIAVFFASAFEMLNQFTDFEAKNLKGNNVATSTIQDKIIIVHAISSKSATYKEDMMVYKELQDIYVKAFFDRYAKKGLVVITLTDMVVDNSLLPNPNYTISAKSKIAKNLIKKYNITSNGGNIIINGKREIVHTNIPVDKLKSVIGSMLTRDRLEINYFE
jgi:glutathione peroxidase-family protein